MEKTNKSYFSRSNSKANFLNEAYNCIPIRVQLEMLTYEDVVRIKKKIKNRSLSRTKPFQQKICNAPEAIVEVEVSRTDSN